MKGFVYILQSEKSGRFYIGSTNDPDRRLGQHSAGLVVATRNKAPWKCVALVEFERPTIARTAEHHLKRRKNRRAIEQVIGGIFQWPSSDG